MTKNLIVFAALLSSTAFAESGVIVECSYRGYTPGDETLNVSLVQDDSGTPVLQYEAGPMERKVTAIHVTKTAEVLRVTSEKENEILTVNLGTNEATFTFVDNEVAAGRVTVPMSCR